MIHLKLLFRTACNILDSDDKPEPRGAYLCDFMYSMGHNEEGFCPGCMAHYKKNIEPFKYYCPECDEFVNDFEIKYTHKVHKKCGEYIHNRPTRESYDPDRVWKGFKEDNGDKETLAEQRREQRARGRGW